MYRIMITQLTEKETTVNKYEKISDTGNKADGGPVYDYVPRTEKETVETTVLLQEIETINIYLVIKAVNNIT